MCGRYTLTANPEQLQQAFPGVKIPEGIAPRYNIAPSQPVAVIANNQPDRLDFFVWGLIPSWAKDPSIGNRMINARAETLTEKPSYRNAFKRRRCLIPASGFYEWRQEPGQKSKTPMYIRMASGDPFAFAGLWEVWNSPDGSQVLSCAIITTEPNTLMADIHNRMPVIIPSSDYTQWLDPNEVKPEKLQGLLKPYEPAGMEAYPVSKLVNSPENDVEGCLLPLTL
jgi:putative SOS response-associated peptidase YedK